MIVPKKEIEAVHWLAAAAISHSQMAGSLESESESECESLHEGKAPYSLYLDFMSVCLLIKWNSSANWIRIFIGWAARAAEESNNH